MNKEGKWWREKCTNWCPRKDTDTFQINKIPEIPLLWNPWELDWKYQTTGTSQVNSEAKGGEEGQWK